MIEAILPAIVSKVFEESAKGLYGEFQRRRIEDARSILLKRLRRGNLGIVAHEPMVASMFAYLRAAEEGTARLNLEAIADLLVTAAAEPTFDPHEFRRHARRLADLSRDEALVLAAWIGALDVQPQSECDTFCNIAARIHFGRIEDTPDNYADFLAVSASLVRTGYLNPLPTGGDQMSYAATRELKAVARLVDLDSAIARAAEVKNGD